jgi:two-component system, NtrC family, sensor kinase
VWIRTREDAGKVCTDITDSGPGISRENADKMFVPFFTTKDADKGHGLGLSISHGIMENHGGGLSFRSSPGEGTVFTAALPVMNEKESRKGAAGRQ